MSDDIVDRAVQALDGVTDGPWTACSARGGLGVENCDDEQLFIEEYGITYAVNPNDALFIAEARSLLPEMAEEIRRLRAAGPWTEHVEKCRAMQLTRDGDCICDTNPSTTDGPQEHCPHHGRPYGYWVKTAYRLGDETERLHTWDGLMELLDEHWPADIFPTLPDDDRRDPGPRIVSLLRWVERLRAEQEPLRRAQCVRCGTSVGLLTDVCGWIRLRHHVQAGDNVCSGSYELASQHKPPFGLRNQSSPR